MLTGEKLGESSEAANEDREWEMIGADAGDRSPRLLSRNSTGESTDKVLLMLPDFFLAATAISTCTF